MLMNQPEHINKYLLVIDDEQEICDLVADVAETLGFFSEQCFDLNHLDELTLDPMPDILVLDLSMPNVDGIEVINHLGTLNQKPQLVLMSGFERSVLDGAHHLAERLSVPVLGQLNKPFSVKSLISLLQQRPIAPFKAAPPNGGRAQSAPVSEDDIIAGLEQKTFIAYFQPQVDLKSGQLHGVETLVRWHRPDGLMMPDEFLPFMEKTDHILGLTETVIEQTLEQFSRWRNAGLPPLQASINLSASHLDEFNLPALMLRLLRQYNANANDITFEITERVGLNNDNQSILNTLTRLRLKGFYLSIDDFGTGYSSLAQLNQLPFNEIKIDKSFVLHLLSSPISRAIVESSISLAQQLGVRCVAEGIETPEIEQALSAMGCDIGQGYLYSKALPPEAFIKWAGNYRHTDN